MSTTLYLPQSGPQYYPFKKVFYILIKFFFIIKNFSDFVLRFCVEQRKSLYYKDLRAAGLKKRVLRSPAVLRVFAFLI